MRSSSRWTAAAYGEQFKRVVEACRIRAVRPDDRLQALDAMLPDARTQVGFAGAHPVAIAGDGVDLAVVRQHAERLRQRPVRKGVGRITLMKDRYAGFVIFITQVAIEGGELRG